MVLLIGGKASLLTALVIKDSVHPKNLTQSFLLRNDLFFHQKQGSWHLIGGGADSLLLVNEKRRAMLP
jgi:hypothetical protein